VVQSTCPQLATDILDRSFLENRARLLEVAAFLDRIDRSREPEAGRADFRYRACQDALQLLASASGERAKALQLLLSDHSPEPRVSAKGLKGAAGAWKERR